MFHIGDAEEVKHGSTLLCEWGDDYCCFSAYDRQKKTLQNLQYVTFDRLTDSAIDNILEEIKKETEYDKILFCSCFSQAILTPAKMHQKDSSFLPHLYDDEKNAVAICDVISEWQMVNSYNFPASLYKKILVAFACIAFLSGCFIFKKKDKYATEDDVLEKNKSVISKKTIDDLAKHFGTEPGFNLLSRFSSAQPYLQNYLFY